MTFFVMGVWSRLFSSILLLYAEKSKMFNKLIASRARRPSATPRRSFESSDSQLAVDMGKRNDSIEFVTLLDVLNEAGLSERQVSVPKVESFSLKTQLFTTVPKKTRHLVLAIRSHLARLWLP